MAEVKWIKLTTDIFDDEKILLIESLPDSYAIITVWFKLLCLAGKQNNSGVFMMSNKIAYTDKMLATIFRMKESTVSMALQTFEQFGMIEIVDGVITIPNWDKHQSLDAYAKKKERDRLYQQERRNKQKLLASKKSSDESSDIAVSEEDKEEDKNKKKIRYKREPFVPPSLEEVQAYCESRGNKVDAKHFYDYFTASEWVDSKGNGVKNWKQKIITWEGYKKAEPQRKVGANGIAIKNEKSDLDGVF